MTRRDRIMALGTQALVLGSTSLAFAGTARGAASCDIAGGIAAGAACAAPDGAKTELFGSGSIFNTVTNTLIFIVGAVSVIVLIIAGLRYVLSAGNASAVTAAKDTILYAVIGIVVALLSYALVNFVLTRLGG